MQVSGLTPFCSQSLGLFQIPPASSPPHTNHSLSPWLFISMLSSNLPSPPEVVEPLKPFAFLTLLKIVLSFLLRFSCPWWSAVTVPFVLLSQSCLRASFHAASWLICVSALHFLLQITSWKLSYFIKCNYLKGTHWGWQGAVPPYLTGWSQCKAITTIAFTLGLITVTFLDLCHQALWCWFSPVQEPLLKMLRSKGGKIARWLLCSPNFLVLHGERCKHLVYWCFVPHGPPPQMP